MQHATRVRAGSENLGSRRTGVSARTYAAEERRDYDETNAQHDPEVVSFLHRDERHQRRCRRGHLIGERRDIKLHALPRIGRVLSAVSAGTYCNEEPLDPVRLTYLQIRTSLRAKNASAYRSGAQHSIPLSRANPKNVSPSNHCLERWLPKCEISKSILRCSASAETGM